jgi:predicted Zn-dependent protease with MMP-like domain
MFYNKSIVEKERFERLVVEAVNGLPQELRELMENVDIIVQDVPSRYQRKAAHGKGLLLGLYEGIPLTERGGGYSLAMPDKITIFQAAIESICSTDAEIERQIRQTVQHEIAHHFGIDDPALERIEARKRSGHERI